MKADSREFHLEPSKVKLWEMKYYSVCYTTEVPPRKKKAKNDDTLIIDFGSSLTRAVSFSKIGTFQLSRAKSCFQLAGLKDQKR